MYFHWGIELDYYPDKKQKDFAHYAIDKGADLVMGSHPHVIQGIEKYKNKYIAYSLGNFALEEIRILLIQIVIYINKPLLFQIIN